MKNSLLIFNTYLGSEYASDIFKKIAKNVS